jgi:hypothetical protein
MRFLVVLEFLMAAIKNHNLQTERQAALLRQSFFFELSDANFYFLFSTYCPPSLADSGLRSRIPFLTHFKMGWK